MVATDRRPIDPPVPGWVTDEVYDGYENHQMMQVIYESDNPHRFIKGRAVEIEP